ncbi:MAG: DNA cytosine methyltransferase [Candidatus ainarchaeum sp.]|nr:DNA cytosine methyltransferase [Candidatus ainarchaeum sp.]
MDLFDFYTEKDKKLNCKINAIDLFAGAGGLTLGLEEAGINVVGFVEYWKPSIETHLKNFPKSHLLGEDITKLSDEDIKKIKSNFNIDMVVGGPPCQGFSFAGKRELNDPRNNLFLEFVRFVNIIKPKYILLENVFGMYTMKDDNGNRVTEIVKSEFKKIGYNIECYLVSADNFGVPQARKRVIFLGNNIGEKLPSNLEWKLSKKHTFRDACGDLKSLKSGEKSSDKYHFSQKHNERHIKWLKVTPEGKSAHENKDPEFRPPSGYKTTYKRMYWDKPAPAVTTCFSSISSQNNVHPKDTRAISIREALRLQSFPDYFEWCGSTTDIRKQIGNAVPPLLAKRIILSWLKEK